MNNSRDIHSFEAMNPPEFGDPTDFSWSTAVKLTFVILIYRGCHHLGLFEPEVTIFWRRGWSRGGYPDKI